LQQFMRVMAHNCFLVLFPILLGCATSNVGQVHEVAAGTYKIGVGRGANSVVFAKGATDATNAAVSQAGQYCHAKGQKLIIVPDTGRDVVFRCGERTQESVAPATSN
jgi:cysteine sulfinate desulfinase/cysteine desulfurase-like protein